MCLPTTLQTQLAAITSISVTLFILRTLYNLFLHPLSRFKGPWYCRASRFPYLYYQVRGQLPHKIREIHEQYGRIVRIAPNDLSFTDSQAWFDIHGHRTNQNMKRFERDPSVYPDLPGRAPSILLSNESDHSRFRRLLSHAFSAQALREQEPIIRSHVELLVKRLDEEIDGPAKGKLDVSTWLNYMAFDVMGDLSFGESFGCLREKKSHPWVDIMFSSLRDIVYLAALSHLPKFIFNRIVYFMEHYVLKDLKKDQNFSLEKVHERIAQGADRDDFMSPVLRANDAKGMSTKEIESSFNIIIVAGSETAAVTISSALYHLAMNPSTMTQIVDEVTSNFKTSEQVTMKSVENLPYLNAVLEESLRIYPPSAFNQARVVPEGGATVCGELLPAGTAVGVGTYAASLSPHNWTEPEAFKPERWLGEGFAGDDRKSAQPFIVGPRMCLGKNLAYAELRLILTHLLLNFEWHLCEESRNWKAGQRFYLLWERPPLFFRIARRAH